MCLASPGRVVYLGEPDGRSVPGRVSFGERPERDVDLAMVPDARVGDYVIVHSGLAISKLTEEEAARTSALLAQIDRDPPR